LRFNASDIRVFLSELHASNCIAHFYFVHTKHSCHKCLQDNPGRYWHNYWMDGIVTYVFSTSTGAPKEKRFEFFDLHDNADAMIQYLNGG